MKIDYDPKADAAYFYLKKSDVIDSDEVSPGIVFDFDAQNEVVGIEILNLRHMTVERVRQVNFPFSSEDKAELKEFFGRTLTSL